MLGLYQHSQPPLKFPQPQLLPTMLMFRSLLKPAISASRSLFSAPARSLHTLERPQNKQDDSPSQTKALYTVIIRRLYQEERVKESLKKRHIKAIKDFHDMLEETLSLLHMEKSLNLSPVEDTKDSKKRVDEDLKMLKIEGRMEEDLTMLPVEGRVEDDLKMLPMEGRLEEALRMFPRVATKTYKYSLEDGLKSILVEATKSFEGTVEEELRMIPMDDFKEALCTKMSEPMVKNDPKEFDRLSQIKAEFREHCQAGRMVDALNWLRGLRMCGDADVADCNVIMRKLIELGRDEEAINILFTIPFDKLFADGAVKALTALEMLKDSQHELGALTCKAIMQVCCLLEESNKDDALKIHSEIRSKYLKFHVNSFKDFLGGFHQLDTVDDALREFKLRHSKYAEINQPIYNFVIGHLFLLGRTRDAIDVMKMLPFYQYYASPSTLNVFLEGCLLGNIDPHEGYKKFLNYDKLKPISDPLTYGLLVENLSREGKTAKALDLIEEMEEKGLVVDVDTVKAVMTAMYKKGENFDELKKRLEEEDIDQWITEMEGQVLSAVEDEARSNIYKERASRDLEEAKRSYKQMEFPDTKTLAELLDLSIKAGKKDEAYIICRKIWIWDFSGVYTKVLFKLMEFMDGWKKGEVIDDESLSMEIDDESLSMEDELPTKSCTT